MSQRNFTRHIFLVGNSSEVSYLLVNYIKAGTKRKKKMNKKMDLPSQLQSKLITSYLMLLKSNPKSFGRRLYEQGDA